MIIGSEQVRLRELRVTDWPDIHAYSRLPEVCQYQPWGPNSPEETRAFVETIVEAASAKPRIHYGFAAMPSMIDRVIGMGTLVIRSGPSRIGELGYFLHPDYWAKGFGTEIGRLLLTLGFGELRLHRIQGTCDPRNISSARIMQKLGMRFEGRLRETMLIRDGWRDSDLYSILEHEWEA